MLTFKQMEALYWIAQLGSFEAAAIRLNTGQSAISKRIHELESSFDVLIFERFNRGARLTEKGTEMFAYARQMLEDRKQFVENFSSKEVLARRIRLGVTELTAMSWLPHLVAAINKAYPKVSVDVEIDLSSTLRKQLSDDKVDLIIVPDGGGNDRLTSVPVGSLENAWMCAPAIHPGRSVTSISELAPIPLIVQGGLSGTGLVYAPFLAEHGMDAMRLIVANNLLAQLGLTISGQGISYLPRKNLNYLVQAGVLAVITAAPTLPPLEFVALYRTERAHSLSKEVARIAGEICDFDTNLLNPTRRAG